MEKVQIILNDTKTFKMKLWKGLSFVHLFIILIIPFFPWLKLGEKFNSGLTIGQSVFGAFPILLFLLGILALLIQFKEKLVFLTRVEFKMEVIVLILSSMIIPITAILFIMKNAQSASFFSNVTIFMGLAVILEILFFIFSLANLVTYFVHQNPGFITYENEIRSNKDMTFKNFVSIRAKLLWAFSFLITFAVLTLSWRIMTEYRKTIEGAVIQTGSTMAAQSADFYKATIGDSIDIESYFKKQLEKNKTSQFAFEEIQFFLWDKDRSIFKVSHATISERVGQDLSKDYYNKLKDITEPTYIIEEKEGVYHFFGPVILAKKFIGLTQITFTKDNIFSSYFKSLIRVAIIIASLLIGSLLLVYLLGSSITMPIIYLQIGVNRISQILKKMISGEMRVSAGEIVYNNEVTSKDEIMLLGNEVQGMVSVIKGIVPYISESTLQNANASEGKRSSKEDLTFLFTDIRGFTTLCEGKDPQEVVDIINRYLELQTEIIVNNGGDVDKFMGDAVMAFFRGKDKELNACRASMDIRKAMRAENEQRTKEGLQTVHIGIGMHTGEVTFGNVGAKNRKDFTSIGDTVNLSSRLEGANKPYGTSSLVSEDLYDKVSDKFIAREIDLIAVKGKNLPVKIYEILGETNAPNADKLKNFKVSFDKAISLYRKQNWEEAKALFEKIDKDFNDETSKIFLGRIEHFKQNPPPKRWDGVFTMTTK